MPARKSTTDGSATRRGWSLLFRLLLDEGGFVPIADSLGLSPPHAHILWRLQPGESLAMSALAKIMSCDKSNVTGLVDRMETQGLVERAAGQDRRIKKVSLTSKGERLRSQLMERLDVPPAAVARLSPEEQERLLALVERALGDDD